MPATDREARLEDRVRDLEDELDRERSRDRGRGRDIGRRYRDDLWDVRDDFTDVGERKIDEIARIFTGAVRASLEGLRVTAESTRYFVDDALERSIPEPDEDPTDVAQRLPADITRSWSRSLYKKLDAPGRAAERFERAWTHEEGGRRTRRRTRSRRDDSPYRRRREPPGEDYGRWSREELYDRAADLRIEGFDEMSRDEAGTSSSGRCARSSRSTRTGPTPSCTRGPATLGSATAST